MLLNKSHAGLTETFLVQEFPELIELQEACDEVDDTTHWKCHNLLKPSQDFTEVRQLRQKVMELEQALARK